MQIAADSSNGLERDFKKVVPLEKINCDGPQRGDLARHPYYACKLTVVGSNRTGIGER